MRLARASSSSCFSFADSEQKRVSALLLERQGKVVPLQLADSELQLGGNPEYHKLKIKSRATIQARAAELFFAEYFRVSWECCRALLSGPVPR
jgi:hypothetical protein